MLRRLLPSSKPTNAPTEERRGSEARRRPVTYAEKAHGWMANVLWWMLFYVVRPLSMLLVSLLRLVDSAQDQPPPYEKSQPSTPMKNSVVIKPLGELEVDQPMATVPAQLVPMELKAPLSRQNSDGFVLVKSGAEDAGQLDPVEIQDAEYVKTPEIFVVDPAEEDPISHLAPSDLRPQVSRITSDDFVNDKQGAAGTAQLAPVELQDIFDNLKMKKKWSEGLQLKKRSASGH